MFKHKLLSLGVLCGVTLGASAQVSTSSFRNTFAGSGVITWTVPAAHSEINLQ